ncbi:fimbrial protein [Photobacterium toruni]|uniref:fimbrial protein n=1 Tax=Photobacterium toruni TaxID=1935446 RepID=UPI002110342D|nr:fimbrial protein [Photobacterium toruni]MEC6816465.1 fimbrial protein [Photobacterium toruni]
MIKFFFVLIMILFSNLVCASNSSYVTSAKLNISLIISNICELHIPKHNVNFNMVSVEQLKKRRGNIISIPITVTCTGSYKNENIALSFKPLNESGHFGLPSSGVLNTTTKNLGILLTTYGSAFRTSYNAKSNYQGNNGPLIFYSPYIISSENNHSFTINAQPIIENNNDTIKSGKFSAGVIVTLSYA